MANRHGGFVWYELFTSDVESAQRFYADVVGWTIADSGMAGVDYRIASSPDGDAVGGLMQPPPGHAGPTTWRGYLEVDEVDAAVDAIVAAGGTLHMPAMDVPGIGRMAMLADPQGATFYVMTSEGADSRAFQPADRATPGHVVWNELAAPDPAPAIAFYRDRFGWRQDGAMPMSVLSDAAGGVEGGSLGAYQFLQHGDVPIGAAMPVVLSARPGWQFYFMAPDIDAGAARIEAGGGAIIQGPDQIPGGSYAVVAEDPQGARFGLVGPRP